MSETHVPRLLCFTRDHRAQPRHRDSLTRLYHPATNIAVALAAPGRFWLSGCCVGTESDGSFNSGKTLSRPAPTYVHLTGPVRHRPPSANNVPVNAPWEMLRSFQRITATDTTGVSLRPSNSGRCPTFHTGVIITVSRRRQRAMRPITWARAVQAAC